MHSLDRRKSCIRRVHRTFDDASLDSPIYNKIRVTKELSLLIKLSLFIIICY